LWLGNCSPVQAPMPEPRKANTLQQIRRLHLYLGVFFAPAIIFFSFTGAMQTFSLHESRPGEGAKPAWIAKLAEIHKNQRLAQPRKPPAEEPAMPNPQRATDGPVRGPEPAKEEQNTKARSARPSPLPLKIFVLFMAVGLISTTLLGIWMAFKYNRDPKVVWGLLIAGAVLPVLLLYV
jgi:hypothetical protein